MQQPEHILAARMALLPEQALADILARAGKIILQHAEIAAIGMVVGVERVLFEGDVKIRHRPLLVAETEADLRPVAVEGAEIRHEPDRLAIVLFSLGQTVERPIGLGAGQKRRGPDLQIAAPLQDGRAGGDASLGLLGLAERDRVGFLGQGGGGAHAAGKRDREPGQQSDPRVGAGHRNLPHARLFAS